jgi:multiple sugar transport system substrate-binding protein
MMRKPWRLMALLLVLLLVAAACGGDDSSDTTAAPGDGDETTTTVAPSDATTTTAGDGPMEVVLRWRTRPDNDQEADVYRSVSDTLSGTATVGNATLSYEAGGTETEGYQQALLTQLGAGEAPDVFWIPGAEIANFAKRGVILNARELADAAGQNDADFYPGPMAEMTTNPDTGAVDADNYLWGLPRDVSAFGLYLNLDLLDEAGAEDPRALADAGEWDWDAFRRVSEDLAKLGSDISPYGQSSWWGPVGYWMNAGGGGFYTEDRQSCNLDSAGSIAGLGFVSDYYADGLALTFGEDPEPVFKAGQVGMFQNGRWATPGIREVTFNWDVVKLPDGPAGPSNWLFWGAYVINADTQYPAEAWALVQALTSADVQGQVAALGANIPSRVSQDALDAFLTFSPPANNQAFLDGLAENPATEAPDWIGDWPSYSSALTTEVGAVISGSRTVADFEANICSELGQYTASGS